MSKSGKTVSDRLADVLVDHRRLFLLAIVVLTCILVAFIPRIEQDLSLKSAIVTGSPSYREYRNFREIFGDDEFLLVAIKNERPIDQHKALTAIDRLTRKLGTLKKATEVLSVANLSMFREKHGKFGAFPFILTENGVPSLPPTAEMDKMRRALPMLDLLLSPDLSAFGVIVRIDDQWKYDSHAVHEVLATTEQAVKESLLDGQQYRIVGGPVIREAFSKYSMRTLITFVILSGLICAVVATFVFGSLGLTMATLVILGLCSVWVLGLMPILGIPMTISTSLVPGLVFIQALEFVIQLVTRFGQFSRLGAQQEEAARKSVGFLARPCFFCAATTAVGYGACMVSNVTGIFQMGLLMSIGALLSYGLAMVLTPLLLISVRPLGQAAISRSESNIGSRVVESSIRLISRRHRALTFAGIVFALVVASGVPFIRADPQLTNDLGYSSPEMTDIRFVESNLASIQYIELELESEEGSFRKADIWKPAMRIDRAIKTVPGVVATESLLPMMRRMFELTSADSENKKDLFEKPEAIPQLLLVMSSSGKGRKMIARYLDEDFARLRISVRVNRSSSATLLDTIDQIRAAAASAANGNLKVIVTGAPVMTASLGTDIIESQIHALLIGVVLVTLLMMIQMGSPLFGLISLIPNIPPLATVFGLIGWLGIPVGAANMFAATVALGLAVDNTLQFVAQLKREIGLNPELGVEQCLFRAYRLVARPIASWSFVIILGFLAILNTPFQSAREFGMLVAVAMVTGVFGDLIFVQSIILTFPSVRRVIEIIMEKERRLSD